MKSETGGNQGEGNMTEKCKWWEVSEAWIGVLATWCTLIDEGVHCLGDIENCEYDQQRIAEEKAEAIDRRAEEERERN